MFHKLSEEQELKIERNKAKAKASFKGVGLMCVAFALFCAFLLGHLDGRKYCATRPAVTEN
jgi:hypothetical protein